jgi:1,5-anhydro-D-fructose reductase (1,5-anhydro-D-mannitol-forming)
MINWGIIGCGDVCEVKSGPAFNLVPNSQLVAVMRRDELKAKDYAMRHKVPNYYNTVAAIIADKNVNAIYIATPPVYHQAYTIQALQAGKPVYVEKPVSLTAIECQQMLAVCNQLGGQVSVAHYRRGLPLFLKIKELITSNAIGNVQGITIALNQMNKEYVIPLNNNDNWRLNPKLSGGGYFHDLAPHQLDILYWIFGEPIHFKGSSKSTIPNVNAPSYTELTIDFAKGIQATGIWNFAAETNSEFCTITGTNGSIQFSFFKNPIIEVTTNNRTTKIELPHPLHIQQPMIEQVVNYFMQKGPNPCSLQEAAIVMQMMDATL